MLTEAEKEVLRKWADDMDRQIAQIANGPMPNYEFGVFVARVQEAAMWLRRAVEK